MSDRNEDNVYWVIIGLFCVYFSIQILPHLVDQIFYDIVIH